MVDFGSLAISSPVGYVATDVRPNEFGGDGLPCAFDAWMAQSVDYINLRLRHACGTDGCLGPLQTSTMISTLLKFKPVRASCEICRMLGPSVARVRVPGDQRRISRLMKSPPGVLPSCCPGMERRLLRLVLEFPCLVEKVGR